MDRIVPGRPATTVRSSGLGESVWVLLGDLRGSFAARFEIVRIEARQSLGLGLRSLWGACAATLLMLSAWWTVCVAFMLLAVEAGAPRLGALLAVAAANAALGLWAVVYARRRAAAIAMPYTRRLFLDPAEARRDEPAEHLDATCR